MNQDNIKLPVQNIEQLRAFYKAVVPKIVQARKQSGASQTLIAKMLNVDRREIIAIEACKKCSFQTLLLYADKMDINIQINFTVN
jgi:DNA-binding XRE family transcriptional regulator